MTAPNTRLIALFNTAKTQVNFSIYLGYGALGCFGVFGTLASMAAFKDSNIIYWCFHYLPYILVGASAPFSLYHAFLMYRYRVMQFMILVIMLGLGVALPIASIILYAKGNVFYGWGALFFGVLAWFSMPYLFRVNIKRFLQFLSEHG